ncbi:hypothetical protein, partial [Snodgrassella sp. CS2]|uniref:hypothetical protein n=1 Tax=Snodgrassella sp. CS2 TaxID=3418953 RepID=UPI003CFCBB9E
ETTGLAVAANMPPTLLVGAANPAPMAFSSKPPVFHCDSSFSYCSRSDKVRFSSFSFSFRLYLF